MKELQRYALVALTILLTGLASWADDIASGTCGDEVKWTIDANGKLTIEPTNGTSGTMKNTSSTKDVPWYEYRESVKSVVVEKGVSTSDSAAYLFYDMSKCTSFDVANLDVSSAKDLSHIFYSCKTVTSLDLTGWTTDNVTDLSYAFAWCTSLTSLDVSTWNTSNVTTLNATFNNCSQLTSLDVSRWNTENVTSLSETFAGCATLTELNVSNWNTGKVTTLTSTFKACKGITSLDLSSWDVSNVTSLAYMFSVCQSLTSLNVSTWNTSKVTDMNNAFNSATAIDSLDLGNWNTESVTNLSWMFESCASLKYLNLRNWDLSNVSSIKYVFKSCPSLETLITPNTVSSSTSIDLPVTMYDWAAGNAEYTTLPGGNLTLHSTAFDGIAAGSVGDGVLWKLGSDGVLTIYPENGVSGTMKNTSSTDDVPWYEYRESVKSVVVKSGVSTADSAAHLFDGLSNCTSIDVANLDVSNAKSLSYMFSKCSKVEKLDVSNWNTGNVTDLSYVFDWCIRLTSLDVSSWNTSNVTTLKSTFNYCEKLKSLDVSQWNTENVTDLSETFSCCAALTELNVSNWKTGNVTTLYSTFNACHDITSLDLNSWDVSNVTTLEYTFRVCQSLTSLNVSTWNTSKVTSMRHAFNYTNKIDSLDLGNWSTESVTNLDAMFKDCASLKHLNLRNWDLSNASDIAYVLANCNKLETLITPKNTVTGTTTIGLPYTMYDWAAYNVEYSTLPGGSLTLHSAKNTTRPITGNLGDEVLWKIDADGVLTIYPENGVSGTMKDLSSTDDVPWYILRDSVTSVVVEKGVYAADSAAHLFDGLSNCTSIDVTNLNVSNTKNLSYIFNDCVALTTITGISGWDVSNATNLSGIFYMCKELTSLDVGNWDVSNVTNLSEVFRSCSNLASLDVISGWDVSNVTDLHYTFFGCESLTSLDISKWKTSNVTDMSYLFAGCKGLTSLNVSTWDVSNVTNLMHTFEYCQGLTSLDISKWNTEKVTNLSGTFYACKALTSLDVNSWNTSNVTLLSSLFNACSNLESLDLSGWKTSNVTTFEYTFSGCTALTSLDINGWDLSNTKKTSDFLKNCSALTTLYTPETISSASIDLPLTMYDWAANNAEYTTLPGGNLTLYSTKVDGIAGGYCGDGVLWKISNDSVLTIYPENGVSGTMENIAATADVPWFDYRVIVKSVVVDEGVSTAEEAAYLFYGMEKCTSFDVANLNVSGAKDLSYMFSGCTAVTSLDLSSWDVSNVTTLAYTFARCKKLTSLNVNSWNTSNVTNLSYTFRENSALTSLDLGNWNTEKVTTVATIFQSCKSLVYLNLRNWDLSNASNIAFVFKDCNVLDTLVTPKTIGSTSISLPYTMYDWDNGGAKYDTLPGGSLTLYRSTTTLLASGNLGDAVLWKITTDGVLTIYPENGVSGTMKNISTSDDVPWYDYYHNVIKSIVVDEGVVANDSANYLFYGLDSCLTADVANLNLSATRSIRSIFQNCSGLTTLDLSSWDVSNVTNMQSALQNCSGLKTLDLSAWSTSNVTNMRALMSDCSSLKSVTFGENWSVASVTNFSNMFSGCQALKKLDVSGWDVSNALNLSRMFAGCKKLAKIDVSKWNVTKVVNMYRMFLDCAALDTIAVQAWNPSAVSNISGMFYGCAKLTALDLSNWDINNSRGNYLLGYTFYNCSSLTSLNLSGWDLSKLTGSTKAFEGCNALDVIVTPDTIVNAPTLPYTMYDWDNSSKPYSVLPGGGVTLHKTRGAINPPSFNPEGGNYNSAQQVVITAHEEATIYYTTDGSDPTTASMVYTDTLVVDSTVTIKAIAVIDDSVTAVTEATYNIFLKPTFNPAGGVYSDTVRVAIDAAEGAKIYYTTDGTTPTLESTIYTDTIVVDSTMTIKAFAVIDSVASEVDSATYTILSAITFTPAAGAYPTAQTVKLSAAEGAKIYYTTDGSEPTTESTLYDDETGISVDATMTIKAIAVIDDSVSRVATGAYTIFGGVTFTPGTGVYQTTQKVTLTTSNGAKIYYTTDGSTPTTASTLYTDTIVVDATKMILAIAAIDTIVSDVDTATYTFLYAPTFSPAGGTYRSAQTVTLTAINGATIYYTTDGSEPTTSSSQYTEGLSVSSATVIKAIAVYGTMTSPMSSADYTFDSDKLEISPRDESTHANGTTIAVSIAGPANTTIYYTDDGTTPTLNSNKYEKPFNITKSTDVRAIAVLADSTIAGRDSIIYRIRPKAPEISFSDQTANGNPKYGSECTITSEEGTDIYYSLEVTKGTEYTYVQGAPRRASSDFTHNVGNLFRQKVEFTEGNYTTYARGPFGEQSEFLDRRVNVAGTVNNGTLDGSNDTNYDFKIPDGPTVELPGGSILSFFGSGGLGGALATFFSSEAGKALLLAAGASAVIIAGVEVITHFTDGTNDTTYTDIELKPLKAELATKYFIFDRNEDNVEIVVENQVGNIEEATVSYDGTGTAENPEDPKKDLHIKLSGKHLDKEMSAFVHINSATVKDSRGMAGHESGIATTGSGDYILGAKLQDIEENNVPGLGDLVHVTNADVLRGIKYIPNTKMLIAKTVDKKEEEEGVVNEHEDEMIDYIKDLTDLQKNDNERSTWVLLDFSGLGIRDDLIEDTIFKYVNHAFFGVNGNYTTYSNNKYGMYYIALIHSPLVTVATDEYEPNSYIVANFVNDYTLGNTCCEVKTSQGETKYLHFEEPEVCEFIHLYWAQWDAANQCFTIPPKSTKNGYNQFGLEGSVNVCTWDFNEHNDVSSELEDGVVYNFEAVVSGIANPPSNAPAGSPRRASTKSNGLSIAPLNLAPNSATTDLEDVVTSAKIIGVTYYNVTGEQSDTPFEGVNIVVTNYDDGSRRAHKMLY